MTKFIRSHRREVRGFAIAAAVVVMALALVAVAVGTQGVFANGSAIGGITTGNADTECSAAGFDFGIEKWGWNGESGPFVLDGADDPSYDISVSGNQDSASWTASPAVDGVLHKEATNYFEHDGGTEGTIEKNSNGISHITFCGDEEPEEPEEPAPTCKDLEATIWVDSDNKIHGGPNDGDDYTGLNLLGTSGDDVIVGTEGNDLIPAGEGSDTVCGLGGDDTIDGGNVPGEAGDDYLCGGPGNDILDGRGGNDILCGEEGDDILDGGEGDDKLDGGPGNDILDGQAHDSGDLCVNGETVSNCEDINTEPVNECSGVLPEPEPETETGTIVIVKDAGLDDSTEFSFTSNTLLGNFSLTGSDSTSTEEGLGSYSVSESVPIGWLLDSAVCEYSDQSTSTPDSIILDENGETVTCTFVNEQEEDPQDPQEPQECSVVIVSDTTNTVVEKGDAFAQLVTFIHPAWTASISGASWIWGDDPVADPVNETIQTFEKSFGWNGPVTSATLELASDNSHEFDLNGTVDGDPSENNHALATQDSYDVSGAIVQGTNMLSVEVTNWEQNGGTTQSNPAGLLYKLTVTGTDAECDIPTEEGTDLELTKDVDDATPDSGQQIVYTVNVINHGPETAENVTVTDALPAGLTFVSASSTVGSYDENTNIWTIGTMLNGETERLDITVSVDVESGTIKNEALADLDPNIDINSENNFDDVDINVNQEGDNGGGGGGGGGGSNNDDDDGGSISGGIVGGASTGPGEVLGEQIAIVPQGAPNTGAGGMSGFGVLINFFRIY